MTRSDDDAPERLLERMGREAVPEMSPRREAALQTRSAASVERLLERMAEKRQLRRRRINGAVFSVAAVAAALLLAIGGSWLSAGKSSPSQGAHLTAASGGVSLFRGAELTASSVQPGLVLAAGDVLATAAGASASLTLADLASVELEPGTRVQVASTDEGPGQARDERLNLTEGRISFHVPKLRSGHTLSVRTPDSLVTVRGTRFSVGVERRGPGALVTRVSVSEGRVQVDSHGQSLFLTPGDQWSSVLDLPRATASALEAPGTVAHEPGAEKRSSPPVFARERSAMHSAENSAHALGSARSRGEPPENAPASTLAVENGIYESALSAGASSRALSELETLMRDYPRSPLIQSARVEHFRVLVKLGKTSAAGREARRYLSDYPAGFAREEARQVALRGLSDGH